MGTWLRPRCAGRRHDAVAVELPGEDESAGWKQYAEAIVEAIGDRRGVVVGHLLGGFTAPLACVRIPVDPLVLVAAMVPSPGERFADWWANAGYEEAGYDDVFYHDVAAELAAEARRRERHESSKALQEPWPFDAWPDTPARYLLCREDPMFRRRGRDATPASASASTPTRWTAAITSASAARASWPTGSPRTPPRH